jgi:hypothetical protein
MMMNMTDALIARLTEGLQPVERLPSPVARAFAWLGSVTLLSVILVLGFSHLGVFMNRIRDPKLVVELIGTLATGILAVVAAFEISLPDRSLKWALLPAPSFALWLGSSGYSCWRHALAGGSELVEWETPRCFAWIVAFGVPLGISLFILLRRSRPLDPGPVAAMAGLGAASIAAFLLQLAGVAAIVVMASAAARRALDGRAVQ